MQGPVAAAYLGAIGDALDLTLEAMAQAVTARFVAHAPADALGWLGAERLLQRFPGDTDDTYRARLAAACVVWQLAGTEDGIIAMLIACGFTDVTVHVARGAIPPGEVSWPPDGDPANWSRFWVFIDASTAPQNPFGWQPWTWGDGALWGDGHTWGSTATSGEVALVRGIVRLLKAAHEICGGIWIDLPGGNRLHWGG